MAQQIAFEKLGLLHAGISVILVFAEHPLVLFSRKARRYKPFPVRVPPGACDEIMAIFGDRQGRESSLASGA
ncbi:hypothetical protein GCM10007921_20510 [Tritonibacter mobilis]|nr:hypothetical protein GCM10007921_20510 [Tritonibacter mobilis]